MITTREIDLARQTADDLRRRGESERAKAIDALVAAAAPQALPALDLLTTTQTGQLIGVSGQTIKNWIRAGKFVGFRVGIGS